MRKDWTKEIRKHFNIIELKQLLRVYHQIPFTKEKLYKSIYDYEDVPMFFFSSVDAVYYYKSTLLSDIYIMVEFHDECPNILSQDTLFSLLALESHNDMKISLCRVTYETLYTIKNKNI